MKVSFKIIKHPRTSLRYMYIVMLNEIGAILLIHSLSMTLTQLQPGTYGLVGSYLVTDLLLIQLIDETFKFSERNNLQNFTYYGKLFLRTLASVLIRTLHS